jgi:hypothetical protein
MLVWTPMRTILSMPSCLQKPDLLTAVADPAEARYRWPDAAGPRIGGPLNCFTTGSSPAGESSMGNRVPLPGHAGSAR